MTTRLDIFKTIYGLDFLTIEYPPHSTSRLEAIETFETFPLFGNGRKEVHKKKIYCPLATWSIKGIKFSVYLKVKTNQIISSGWGWKSVRVEMDDRAMMEDLMILIKRTLKGDRNVSFP